MTEPDITITVSDIRKVHMCSRGARAFFARHGLDWNKFLSDGLPSSVILATKDSMAEEVVEVARGRF